MVNQQARWLNQLFSYLFIFFPLVTPGTVTRIFCVLHPYKFVTIMIPTALQFSK